MSQPIMIINNIPASIFYDTLVQAGLKPQQLELIGFDGPPPADLEVSAACLPSNFAQDPMYRCPTDVSVTISSRTIHREQLTIAQDGTRSTTNALGEDRSWTKEPLRQTSDRESCIVPEGPNEQSCSDLSKKLALVLIGTFYGYEGLSDESRRLVGTYEHGIIESARAYILLGKGRSRP